MNIKVNNHKIVIMTFIIVISISCPSVAFAESDFGNIVNEVTMEDDSNISKAIGKGTVLATRESPTKIKYTFNTTFTPTADSVTMKVWRCTYSSSTGKWVPQGAALKYSYISINKITKTSFLTVTSGKTYKVKVSVTEKRGGVTNTKTFYSVPV